MHSWDEITYVIVDWLLLLTCASLCCKELTSCRRGNCSLTYFEWQ